MGFAEKVMKYKINLILVFILIASLFGACTVRRPPDVKEFAKEALVVLVEDEDITTDTDKLNIGEGCTYDDECEEGLLCGSFFWHSILDIDVPVPTIELEQITVCQSDDAICKSPADCDQYNLDGEFTCIDGQCFKLQENGQTCSNNSDCVSNRCCDDGKCAKACKVEPFVPVVVICTANMPCISGYCCNGICTAEACNVGDTCLEDSDYEPGCCYLGSYTEEKCDDGSCPPCKVEPFVPPFVATCTTNNDCLSYHCCDGTCTAKACIGDICSDGNECNSGYCCDDGTDTKRCDETECTFIVEPILPIK